MARKKYVVALTTALGFLTAGAFAAGALSARPWWAPGDGRLFKAQEDYVHADGVLRTILEGGDIDTKGHAFFEPMGKDGRACVTCHQPADGMGLSVESIKAQWTATKGKDPLFAAYDGSNCLTLPQGIEASHSLLLEHGLIRIQRPWPPKDVAPDFDIEVVRDPYGCNTGKTFGLTASTPTVSVYRRPRPVANMKFLLAMGFAYDPKDGMPLRVDPETGRQATGNLMADARHPSLKAQLLDAGDTHLQMFEAFTPAQQAQIIDFENRIFTAQIKGPGGVDLDQGGAIGGPKALMETQAGLLGGSTRPVWSEFQAWENMSASEKASLPKDVVAYRESVARGARVFREKTFIIYDSAGINSPVGFGNPVRNSCVFCHNMAGMGNDVAPGQVDLGTTTQPFSDPAPHLPLFRITCKGPPHPHYGRVILTSDPGYGLTSGKCADVGKITLQSLRGLSTRAPYFVNGTAKDLRGVIDYYERRYNIGYTEQEKVDLINLMKAL
ncbi:MAG: hypothetical protein QM645_01240 [Asticcacaulis sp.]